jgi:hypothetical protein
VADHPGCYGCGVNVRIIDPGKSFSVKPRHWGQNPEGGDLGDLDEMEAVVSDDRLELLVELRALQHHILAEGAGARLVPQALRTCWLERAEVVRLSIGNLEMIAGDLGLELPPARRIDLRSGFADLDGKPVGDPLSNASGLIGAALFFNALGLAVVTAFLREEEKAVLKDALIPLLAADSCFEGRLIGYLDGQGTAAEARVDEWLSLAAGAGSGKPGRVWSFDLLRMGIRRLLGRGFFPVE